MNEELDDISDIPEAQDHVSEYREAAEKCMQFFRCWAIAVQSFRGERQFAFECALLALGWGDIVGVENQQQLAHRWKCEREMVRRLMTRIQKLTGAPPTLTQRSEVGRRKMSDKRKGQLK